MNPDWIEHKRGDRELLGWIAPDGDGFVVFDLLGRSRTPAPVDWLDAEELLEELGIGYLADRYSRRYVISGSLLVWSAVTWATGNVMSYEQLLATRALIVISEAMRFWSARNRLNGRLRLPYSSRAFSGDRAETASAIRRQRASKGSAMMGVSVRR